jgi:exopolyphosphatase/guanosine-5'-triphosphate,3'-diphosphate pyrophosphatase
VKCLHAHLAWYLVGGDDPVGRWVVERLGIDPSAFVTQHGWGRPDALVVAAIDCGTNSTRLLIGRDDGTTVDRRMRITRLGTGVDRSGELQPSAIDRTLDVLRQYHEAMVTAGATAVAAVATSAIRDAANAAAFLGPAGAALGTELRVLSGAEEGRLSYRGATSELPDAGRPYLVVDVGGGSTELVTKAGDGSVEAASLDVGCVRVTERFLGSDPPTDAQLTAARAYVVGLLETARAEHSVFAAARSLVGLAGTVSALTMLSLGLGSYDRAAVHHARLSRAVVSRLYDDLRADSLDARRARAGMEHDRADVIVGGAVVLLSVMEVLGFEELVVSESDILDGIVAELLEN